MFEMLDDFISFLQSINSESYIEYTDISDYPSFKPEIVIDGKFNPEELEQWFRSLKSQSWDEGYSACNSD